MSTSPLKVCGNCQRHYVEGTQKTKYCSLRCQKSASRKRRKERVNRSAP